MDAMVKNLGGAAFRKGSRSGPNGACVEVGKRGPRVRVRDSKLDDSPVMDGGAALIAFVRGYGG